MHDVRIATALSGLVGDKLARDLATDFVKIRQDVAAKALERSSPGKFVETFVQCLQQMERGSYDAEPKVDRFLNVELENATGIPDGLRICGGRIARAMYTLRNKRSIAHKGEIDPSGFDLTFISQGAAWIVAEMIRCASGVSMDEAGALVVLVQTPITTPVEEVGGIRLVHGEVSVRAEIVLLLQSKHPDPVTAVTLMAWMPGRSASQIVRKLNELKTERKIVGDTVNGFQLTRPGVAEALEKIADLA
jgi:hypothetical protein